MLILEIIYSLFLYSLFGIVHTVLASEKIKLKVVEFAGDKIAFYRLGYNIISVLTIYLIWKLLPELNQTVFDLPYPYDLTVLLFQLVGLAGFFWCMKYFCFREFIGLAQIDRWFSGNYDKNSLDEESVFMAIGPYKYSRHPIYFFSILILMFRPYMDLQYLLFLICAVIYFYIGAYFEEKKLLNKFGNDYLDYSSKVPRIVPYKILRGTRE